MVEVMTELSSRYPENHLVLVLDGASSYRSGTLEIPDQMTLVPLPPYSPELNPQENVWAAIKPEGFYNRVFDTLDVVEDQLVKMLKQFEQQTDRLRSLAGFGWILHALIF